MMSFRKSVSPLCWGLAIAILSQPLWVLPIPAKTVQVKVNRWLELRQIKGTVLVSRQGRATPANSGDRLEHVGDSIITKKNASVLLALDSNVGNVTVGENTQLRIQSLQIAGDGGRVTRLEVLSGNVRLQVRRFTRSGSRLEIQTPAGVAGVRGTDFGVTVQPDGKTSVATLNGNVATAAQNQEVMVSQGLQTSVIPGEPPLPPTPLTNNSRLMITVLLRSGGEIRFAGQTDPVNLVTVDDQVMKLDRDGNFDTVIPFGKNHRLSVVVSTPLQSQSFYEIAVP